jgi:hypothetical protein
MSFDLKIISGDLSIKNGSLQTVVDSEKLIQDILKICLTTAGTNPIHPWYGSFISRTIVGSAMDTSMLLNIAQSQLISCLENLKSLQELQVKSLQRVSADEQLNAVLAVSIVRNKIDLRYYDIKIKALTKGLKPISTNFNVSTI